MTDAMTPPSGSADLATKLALFHDGRILAIKRDDFPDIPYPAHWDLPGGEIDPGETPLECGLRELAEEVALTLPPERLSLFGSRLWVDRPDKLMWYFSGTLTETEANSVRLGDEGTELIWMPIAEFVRNPLTVPAFRHIVEEIIQSSHIALRGGSEAADGT